MTSALNPHCYVSAVFFSLPAGTGCCPREQAPAYTQSPTSATTLLGRRSDLKDGSVEEWYGGGRGAEHDSAGLRRGRLWNAPLDPSDLDFRIWLAWHDNPARFYLAFVSSDDIYKNNHDYNVDG